MSLLIVALASFVAAAIQSTSGFGFALIAGPVFFAVLEPQEAVASVLALASVVTVAVLVGEGRSTEIRRRDLAIPLVLAVPGLGLGVLLLRAVDKGPLQIAVGVAVIAAVALIARPQTSHDYSPDGVRAPALDSGLGVTVGVLTTTTGVNGPPLLLWLLAKGATPVEVRDTLAFAFAALNLAGLATVVVAGGIGVLGGDVALLVPVTLAGWLVGRVGFSRLDSERFRSLNLSLAAAAGVASVVAGSL